MTAARQPWPVLAAAAGALLLGAALVRAGFAPEPTGAAAVMQGAGLYARHCAGCHGAALEGGAAAGAPPLDAAGHAWEHPDAQLAWAVARGLPGGMPAFGEQLGRAEIRAVLDYVRSRWPEELRLRQAALDPGGDAALAALLQDPAARLPGTCRPAGAGEDAGAPAF